MKEFADLDILILFFLTVTSIFSFWYGWHSNKMGVIWSNGKFKWQKNRFIRKSEEPERFKKNLLFTYAIGVITLILDLIFIGYKII